MLTGLMPGDQVVAVASAASSRPKRATRNEKPTAAETEASPLRTLIGLAVLAGLVFVIYKLKTGSSIRTAISGPETIADETYTLDESEGRVYGFSFTRDRRIHVSLHARPERVNLFLMNESSYDEYTRARQKLLGGTYHYIPELSVKGVVDAEREALLPAGAYRIVVERPHDSIVLTDKTTAHVVITGM